MKNLDVGPLLVCEGDYLVGMITDRDITVRATAEGLPPRLGQVRDVMTPDIVYCSKTRSVHGGGCGHESVQGPGRGSLGGGRSS